MFFGLRVFLRGMTLSDFVTGCYGVIYQRPLMELLSLMVVMLEGLGFNLCVAPFLNICVPNLPWGVKDGECQRWSERFFAPPIERESG